MTQQIVNIGAAPNDHTGDPLRTGGGKINENCSELSARTRTRITAGGTSTISTASKVRVLVNVAALVTLNLPAPSLGQVIVIKDIGGNAGAFNITVHPSGTDKIDNLTG